MPLILIAESAQTVSSRSSHLGNAGSELTTRSPRPAPRSAGISASTIPADRIRASTGRRRIEPTSPGCRRSRRLEPGRGSTYRAGKTVRTDRASSVFFRLHHIISSSCEGSTQPGQARIVLLRHTHLRQVSSNRTLTRDYMVLRLSGPRHAICLGRVLSNETEPENRHDVV